MKHFALFTVLVLANAAAPTISRANATDTRSVADVQSMTIREDGSYDVVCKNGKHEIATVQQIHENKVCGGDCPIPAGVVAIFSRPEGNFFVLCKGKSWEIATAVQVQGGNVCGGAASLSGRWSGHFDVGCTGKTSSEHPFELKADQTCKEISNVCHWTYANNQFHMEFNWHVSNRWKLSGVLEEGNRMRGKVFVNGEEWGCWNGERQ